MSAFLWNQVAVKALDEAQLSGSCSSGTAPRVCSTSLHSRMQWEWFVVSFTSLGWLGLPSPPHTELRVLFSWLLSDTGVSDLLLALTWRLSQPMPWDPFSPGVVSSHAYSTLIQGMASKTSQQNRNGVIVTMSSKAAICNNLILICILPEGVGTQRKGKGVSTLIVVTPWSLLHGSLLWRCWFCRQVYLTCFSSHWVWDSSCRISHVGSSHLTTSPRAGPTHFIFK